MCAKFAVSSPFLRLSQFRAPIQVCFARSLLACTSGLRQARGESQIEFGASRIPSRLATRSAEIRAEIAKPSRNRLAIGAHLRKMSLRRAAKSASANCTRLELRPSQGCSRDAAPEEEAIIAFRLSSRRSRRATIRVVREMILEVATATRRKSNKRDANSPIIATLNACTRRFILAFFFCRRFLRDSSCR